MDELMKKEDENQKFQDQEAKMRKTTIELLHSAEGILLILPPTTTSSTTTTTTTTTTIIINTKYIIY